MCTYFPKGISAEPSQSQIFVVSLKIKKGGEIFEFSGASCPQELSEDFASLRPLASCKH